MDETNTKFPDQKELEKELSDYLSKKYGDRVKIISPFYHAQTGGGRNHRQGQGRHRPGKINFDLKPEELEDYLNEYVIKQDTAKSILATKVCTHFNRIRYLLDKGRQTDPGVGSIKNNIILIGPTGVGKTYLVKLIAKKMGVPFVKGDATKFSETGYVGGDVEDLVRDLVYEAATIWNWPNTASFISMRSIRSPPAATSSAPMSPAAASSGPCSNPWRKPKSI